MRQVLWTAVTVAVLAGTALGQATRPALPPGHMPIDGAPRVEAPALPPGHMPIDGAGATTRPALPPGHMPIDGMGGGTMGGGGMPALPPGHMPIPGMPGAAGAATQATKGSITLQAVAGSAGGKPVANLPVKVELYHQGRVLQTWDEKLDAAGALTIKDVPVRLPCQPLVTVTHEGLEQQALGPVLDGAHADQTFQFKVYEPAAEMPAWTVGMRHAIVEALPDGTAVHVTEMMEVNNPSDRVWLGKAGASGAKETLVMPLPAGATDVQTTMGFDERGTALQQDGAVHTNSPLFPGPTQFALNYVVPAENGAVTLPIRAVADTGQMMLVAPANGATVQATGLEGGKTVDLGRGPMRVFHGKDMKAGSVVTVSVSGITAQAEGTPTASTNKKLAIVGGLGVVVAGVTVLCLKRPKSAKQA